MMLGKDRNVESYFITLRRSYNMIGVEETEMEKIRRQELSVLPPEIRDAYLEVTKYHHALLERLAQR